MTADTSWALPLAYAIFLTRLGAPTSCPLPGLPDMCTSLAGDQLHVHVAVGLATNNSMAFDCPHGCRRLKSAAHPLCTLESARPAAFQTPLDTLDLHGG